MPLLLELLNVNHSLGMPPRLPLLDSSGITASGLENLVEVDLVIC